MNKFGIILFTITSFFIYSDAFRFQHQTLESKWLHFKKSNNKLYANEAEERQRFSIFHKNLKYILQHNEAYHAGKVTFKLKLNRFADLSRHEFMTLYLHNESEYRASSNKEVYSSHNLSLGVPKYVDWRLNGSVTEVKDQGKCKSSFAFAATGVLESQYFNETGVLEKFSEQNLLDCSGNSNCTGGDVRSALTFVQKNKGIDSETAYPYQGNVGKCKSDIAKTNFTIKDINKIEAGAEWELESAIAMIGPVSVCFDGSLDSFRFYSSGIYYDPACSKTTCNQFGVAVGYGTDKKSRYGYYIVKNSWSKLWGENGYVRMRRFYNNNCGIASNAVYPII